MTPKHSGEADGSRRNAETASLNLESNADELADQLREAVDAAAELDTILSSALDRGTRSHRVEVQRGNESVAVETDSLEFAREVYYE